MWNRRSDTIKMTAIILLVIVIALLLTFPAEAQGEPGGLTPDQLHAAQIAAGETPAGLLGEGAYTFTLCTMLNRVASPHYPDTLRAVVDGGFYAKPRRLTWEEYQIAVMYLVQGERCTGASDVFYAFSEQDRQRHGWQRGDFAFERELPSGTILAVHFYRHWPEVR